MTGEQMRLRFPEGVRSLVDAQLTVRGTTSAATLSGTVDVRDAVYTRAVQPGRQPGRPRAGGGAPSPAAAAPAQPTLPLRYDVRINAPSTLQVRNNTHPADGAGQPAAARHLRPAAALRPRRSGPRRGHVRRASATASRAASIDLSNPTRHRAVLRPRDGNARTRAGRDLPRHAARSTAPSTARCLASRPIRRCPSRRSWRCSSATSRRGRTSSSAATAPTSRRSSSCCASARRAP